MVEMLTKSVIRPYKTKNQDSLFARILENVIKRYKAERVENRRFSFLKTVCPHGHGSSNLPPSAKTPVTAMGCWLFPCLLLQCIIAVTHARSMCIHWNDNILSVLKV